MVVKIVPLIRLVAKQALIYLRPPELWDGLCALGLILIALGLWQIYPPATPIFSGAAFLGLGIWGASTWTKERSKRFSTRRPVRS